MAGIHRNRRTTKQITLKEEFKWFLSEEFDKLREGFIVLIRGLIHEHKGRGRGRRGRPRTTRL